MEIVIKPGMLFDTDFDTRCEALEVPNESGVFRALDSDGIEQLFAVSSVTRTY